MKLKPKRPETKCKRFTSRSRTHQSKSRLHAIGILLIKLIPRIGEFLRNNVAEVHQVAEALFQRFQCGRVICRSSLAAEKERPEGLENASVVRKLILRLTGCLNAEVHFWVGGVGDGISAELDGGTVTY
jgi:hypothetical protein